MKKGLYTMGFLCICLLTTSCTNSQSTAKQRAVSATKKKSSATTDSISVDDTKATVKLAAMAFLKWVDYKWEGESVKVAAGAWKYIHEIIVYKRGTTFNQCPCKINWAAMSKLDAWIKVNAPIISNKYMADFRQEMKKMEPYLNTTHDDFEAEPPYTAFYFSVGNGGLPELNKTDIYKSTSIWQIDFATNTTASVNVTFRMPKEWGGKVNAYKFEMIREERKWKAATNLEEGIISPTA